MITSIRLGFANNSSSSHSILIGCTHESEPSYGPEYGWDCFHLTSKEDKLNYLAATVYSNLPYEMEHEVKARVVEELTGINIRDSAYVDHSSLLALPASYDGKAISKEYF